MLELFHAVSLGRHPGDLARAGAEAVHGGTMLNLGVLSKRRAVGLDIGTGAIKALTMEGRGRRMRVTGLGITPIDPGADTREVSQAINTALATAGADGEPVVTSVGGPEVVIRHVSL